MKLKEIPTSIKASLKLMLTNMKDLGNYAAPAEEKVVISLTSIESRLGIIFLTIRSLLNQNVKADLIILWLHHDLADKIPKRLKKLQGERFEIRFCHKNCSHRKLVETYPLYPDSIIVTCDDDVIYPVDWLARLLQEHQQHPLDVIGHECRMVSYDTAGELLPYTKWHFEESGNATERTIAIGYGGVLYPAKCMHADLTNEALYSELASRVDDLWFKAMSYKNGTFTRRSSFSQPKPIPILFSQAVSLKKTNIKRDDNRMFWLKICAHYKLDI